ncbi:MAG: DUF1553 domain-containing protein [Planctomycetaceae bacterium]|nr:DUF1553 domain-containing protein [Planctomycetaceae bacterium]
MSDRSITLPRLNQCLVIALVTWAFFTSGLAQGDEPGDHSPEPFARWPFEEDIERLGEDVPSDVVRVEIMEGVNVPRKWEFDVHQPELLFETDYFAIKNLPQHYDSSGLIDELDVPALLRLTSRVELPAGEYEFILRSLDAARLYVDGKLVGQTKFMNLNGSAHQAYYEGLDRGPEMLSLAEGHQEQRVTVELEGSSHVVSLYRLLGNEKHGSYHGEMLVAVAPKGGEFRILGPIHQLPFTDGGWLDFLEGERKSLVTINQIHRRQLAQSQNAYWQERHDYARSAAPPEVVIPEVDGLPDVSNPIDQFVLARLLEENVQSASIVDDLGFLRRVTLDTTGLLPSEDDIATFLSLPEDQRRPLTIDHLLDDDSWADHWVSYWQDVLAENPGLTKPELNNTGPFRWFLHESFLDNKPFDRLVSELILMQGSRYSGGPAGFSVASQNDLPMAAKAHILGTAFLGIDMKCARCHDAPYHDVKQEDLFSLAAMLDRKPIKVPGSSSVPVSDEQTRDLLVQVSLKPGDSISPDWPFGELRDNPFASHNLFTSLLTATRLQDAGDRREQLAWLVTSPENTRFAKVIVNRLWARYLGRGIAEPIDDWEHADCSHPELLDFLAREFITHDYDLKHIARLILNSQAYQRATSTQTDGKEAHPSLFASSIRRRMTAEQMVDSLHHAVGKPFNCEELSMDRDGKRGDSTFGHFGIPHRAWELVAVSNERDRPSLNLPTSQSVIDLLAAYGWRQQRQEPLTHRENALTPLQPMALANGTAANRLVDLSDHCELTDLCLTEQPVDELVDRVFQRLLTRPPTDEERELFVGLLQDGYENRVIAGPDVVPPRRIYRSGITWINHFDPKADDEAIRRQREILDGDPPTSRLDADWRNRMEDGLWALMNSPEFLFIP